MANNKQKKSKTVATLKRRFNFQEWGDWGRIKGGGEYIANGARQIFVPTPTHPVETFDEAQKRLRLSDESLIARSRALWRTSVVMAGLAMVLFCYGTYHVVYGTLHSGILSFSLTFLSLAFAVRYHFWYFQISQKKLGCTLWQWFYQGLLGKKT